MPSPAPEPGQEIADRVAAFVHDEIIPYEHDRRLGAHGPSADLVDELRDLARSAGVLTPHIIDGSEPAPPSSAGSVIRNAERCTPATSGFRNRSFCSGVATLCSRYILPSSGAMMLSATGPSGE